MAAVTAVTAERSTLALKCHTDRATLVHALTTVGVGVPRRPAVPSLGGVLLDGRDGHLTLTATDCETTVSVRVPDAVHTPGRLLIDHAEATKMLGALVKGVRKRDADTMPATVRAAADGTAVLDLGGYTMPLTTFSTDDYPALPAIPSTVAEMSRERFASDAARVLVATDPDDALPMTTGVQLHFRPGTLTLAGTDRYRLAVADIPATTAVTEDRTALFPARVLSAVLKHCSAERVRIGLDTGYGWVSLSCGALTVVTRPVEVTFPSYEELFPDTTVTACAGREVLAQATTRATAALEAKKHLARDGSGTVRAAQVAVTVDPVGSVSVAPLLGDHAGMVTAPEYPAEIDGAADALRVFFSARYLRDALNSFDGDTVTLQLETATRPVMFTSTAAPGYRHLLMPVRQPQP